MVEKAIEQYLKVGGTVPYAIVTDTGLDGFLAPTEVFVLTTGLIAEGHFAVMPLQAALDFAFKTVWVNTYDSTNGVKVEETSR